ncbi:hypothetical protein B4U79_18427 [Dinothrombium tinctorium]|uniref:RING-type domain-containing protein n=1 Tax=Dinothrombium tinctorium TaxID=1965070 RepID=A0A3S3RR29_9ACAR|nr:hypothetical protein B4U79_18427 [Dinothrombium tinctorium]
MIRFHSIHSKNIDINSDATLAVRKTRRGEAIVMSNAPIRLLTLTVVFKFGFTQLKSLYLPLPLEAPIMVCFYVSDNGDVHHIINGDYKGVFLSEIKVDKPFWAVIDLYDALAVKLVDPCPFHGKHEAESLPIDPIRPNESCPSSEAYQQLFVKRGVYSPRECKVCFEKTVNSVFYRCGHMLLCYECSMKQWKEHNRGRCPVCRAVIEDVIRVYES